MKATELESRLQAAKDMEKKFNKENKTGKVEAEGKSPTVDKLEAAITKLEQRIETMELQAQDKEENKEVALGTSKIVRFCPLLWLMILDRLTPHRTTSTLVLLWFSARSSMFLLRSSSPSPSGRSSNGPSSRSKRIGNSRFPRPRRISVSRILPARSIEPDSGYRVFPCFHFPLLYSLPTPVVKRIVLRIMHFWSLILLFFLLLFSLFLLCSPHLSTKSHPCLLVAVHPASIYCLDSLR